MDIEHVSEIRTDRFAMGFGTLVLPRHDSSCVTRGHSRRWFTQEGLYIAPLKEYRCFGSRRYLPSLRRSKTDLRRRANTFSGPRRIGTNSCGRHRIPEVGAGRISRRRNGARLFGQRENAPRQACGRICCRGHRSARLLYERGVETFLPVLDAERSLYAAHNVNATLPSLISLYKSLGGGSQTASLELSN
jgi:hypothetical protein